MRHESGSVLRAVAGDQWTEDVALFEKASTVAWEVRDRVANCGEIDLKFSKRNFHANRAMLDDCKRFTPCVVDHAQ